MMEMIFSRIRPSLAFLRPNWTKNQIGSIRGYAKRRGRLTSKQLREIRASRKPYIPTKVYLRKLTVEGVNPIYGTYSSIVLEMLRKLGYPHAAATQTAVSGTGNDAVDAAVELTDSKTGFGVSDKVVSSVLESLVERDLNSKQGSNMISDIQQQEESVKRVLSSRRAPIKSAKSELKQQMVALFGAHSLDTASPEVLASAAQIDILALAEHCKINHKDKHAWRQLLMAVHRRNKNLKYLRKTNLARYTLFLRQLGLSDDNIIQPFYLLKQYLA
ncbi:mitochondrial 37S ribosomal protein uS15m [Lipomyces oligophaga]|uniref:mitochondrial 37S ribosomal protein uS15m n=1 Tax=Lipomyces oligophaga TaxID=45792 RepID=UPI0034CE3FAF